MLNAFEFCIPTKATTVPTGPNWLHEIKYDGYAWSATAKACDHALLGSSPP
jgi:hypothetical protein